MNKIFNEFFSSRLNKGDYLLTTRHGLWTILHNAEFYKLMHNKYERNLFSKLEKAGLVLTKENIPEIINAYRKQYVSLAPLQMLCIINFSHRCNLNCGYCHVPSKKIDDSKEDMNEETKGKILDFLNSLPHKEITLEFQGGEPLIMFDKIRNVLDEVKKNKTLSLRCRKKTIVTNMTLMNEPTAKYLITNSFSIGSSLDGPEKLHNKQRRSLHNSGTYHKVIKWSEWFKLHGIEIGFTPTITSLSLKYGAKKIIDEYVSLGQKHILFRPIQPTGRAKNSRFLMRPEEFFNFWKNALDYIVELSKKNIRIKDKKIEYMLKNIFTPYRRYMCMRRPCGAGISQLSFAPDGSIFACDAGRSNKTLKLGNVKTCTYNDVVSKTIDLRALTSEFQPLCNSCIFTAFCGSCISRISSVRKDIISKTPIDFDCKVHYMMFMHLFQKMKDPDYKKVFLRWVA